RRGASAPGRAAAAGVETRGPRQDRSLRDPAGLHPLGVGAVAHRLLRVSDGVLEERRAAMGDFAVIGNPAVGAAGLEEGGGGAAIAQRLQLAGGADVERLGAALADVADD